MDARAVSLAMWSLAKMRLVSPGDPLLIEIEQCSLVAMDKFGHQVNPLATVSPYLFLFLSCLSNFFAYLCAHEIEKTSSVS